MTEKAKAEASNFGSKNPFDYFSGNQRLSAFDYAKDSPDLQCFNCEDDLRNKDFDVGVCRVDSSVTAFLPLCAQCFEFLQDGAKDLKQTAYKRLREKVFAEVAKEKKR